MIRSDRGSHFANDLIKEFLDLTGTPHNLTLAYSSQENAIVERVNKEVNRHLRGLVFDTPSLEHYAKCILSDHLILSRYVCSNIVANIVSNIYMYVMRHVRT